MGLIDDLMIEETYMRHFSWSLPLLFFFQCKPEYKVPGLYVIDSIVRQSRHQVMIFFSYNEISAYKIHEPEEEGKIPP